MKGGVIPIVSGVLSMGTGEGRTQKTSLDNPNYSIMEVGLKYREESKRCEKARCHTDSSERPPAEAGTNGIN